MDNIISKYFEINKDNIDVVKELTFSINYFIEKQIWKDLSWVSSFKCDTTNFRDTYLYYLKRVSIDIAKTINIQGIEGSIFKVVCYTLKDKLSDSLKIIIMDNIVIFMTKEIGNYLNIYNRIVYMNQKCDSNSTFEGGANNYTAMIFDVDKIDYENNYEFSISDLDEKKIAGFFNIVLYKHIDLMEIYDVCNSLEFRGRGFMSKLLKNILNETYITNIWLGLKLDNLLWDKALKLYANSGFQNPELVDRTKSGTIIGFPVLGLTYNKNRKIDTGISGDDMKIEKVNTQFQIDNTITNSNLLRDIYNFNLHKCSIGINIDKNLLESMRDGYLQQPVEYAGVLKVLQYYDTGNKYEILATTSVDPLLEVKGSDKTFSVQNPNISSFTFHTHPAICYITLKCYLGWPSSPDLTYVLSTFLSGQKLHMVITIEGIYLLQLNYNFIPFWVSIPDKLRLVIQNAVYSFFGTTEIYRSADIIKDEQSKLENFHKFINTINSYSVYTVYNSVKIDDDLIKYKPPFDIIIFSCTFINWENIKELGKINIKLYYPLNEKNSCKVLD